MDIARGQDIGRATETEPATQSRGSDAEVHRMAAVAQRAQADDVRSGTVHRHGSGAGQATDANSVFRQATSGGGGEVPYRGEMEQAFGQDFGGVSSHTGRAAEMGSIGATAAAQGEDVVFASRSPDKKTVAHELTHVVQSRQGQSAEGPQRMANVSAVDSPAEREAEAVSERVASGLSAGMVSASNSGAVHRVGPAILAGLKTLGGALATEAAANAATVAGTMLTAAAMATGQAPGSNGAAAHTFEEGAGTEADKLKIEQFLTFETVNRYIAQELSTQIAAARAEAGNEGGGDTGGGDAGGGDADASGGDTDASGGDAGGSDAGGPSQSDVPELNTTKVQAIQNTLKREVEAAFRTNKAQQQGTATFTWSDSGSHERDFWGTVGEIVFLNHENTHFSGDNTLSADAQFLDISLSGGGSFEAVKYLGGLMEAGDIHIGHTLGFDNDSLKIWVAAVSQRSYNNDHVQILVQTDWQWDDNTTNCWVNINTAVSGPTVVLDRWSSAQPDD